MRPPPFLEADAIARLLPPARAVAALEAALREGLDPSAEPARISVPGANGELLVMPSTAAGTLGVKLATVAPPDPERALPRIQGVYVLFDPETLAPVALLDGIALTLLRTSAVSALAVLQLSPSETRRMLVFGSGPQAQAHVEAVRTVRPIARVDVVARNADRIAALVERCRASGLESSGISTGDVDDRLARADVVCCCTTAREPLFDGDLPAPSATIVAVGSHEPGARELDERLLGRSTVVVEDRETALREAGDVIVALDRGPLARSQLVTLAELVRGDARPSPNRPRVFKSTGMAWEDAVVAAAVVANL